MDAASILDAPSLPFPELEPDPSPVPVPGMFDLILRGETRLHRLMREEAGLPEVIQKLLELSVLGLTIHGLVLGLAAGLFEPDSSLAWYQAGHPVVWMPLALIAAFLGARCICLPSFYFYTRLSGLDASFRLVGMRERTAADLERVVLQLEEMGSRLQLLKFAGRPDAELVELLQSVASSVEEVTEGLLAAG
jgi:hypothetical protein